MRLGVDIHLDQRMHFRAFAAMFLHKILIVAHRKDRPHGLAIVERKEGRFLESRVDRLLRPCNRLIVRHEIHLNLIAMP
jgi:hypothetical protein